jgi:hypothetical protein
MKYQWIKWYPIRWLHSTARDELSPSERSVFHDFVCLAAISENPGTFKFTNIDALSRQINTSSDVIKNTIKICQEKERIKLQQDKEACYITISKWGNYQSIPGVRTGNQNLSVNNKTQKHRFNVNDIDKIRIEKIRIEKKKKKYIKKKKNKNPFLFEKEFDTLWDQWPQEGRFKKKYCREKFNALCKQGKLDLFKKITFGYSSYLESQQKKRNFSQQVMHLSTWLNNWEEEKDQYLGFKYEPPL